MRRRIGNDLTIKWTITNKGGSPYNLEGKDISLIYSTSRTKTRVREFSVSGNVITWVFYGLEQKECGTYTLTLIENENEVGMVTLDSCQAFTLVPLSCMENDNDTGVDVDNLELDSTVNIGQVESISWGNVTGKPSNFADWNAEEGSEKFISNKPVIPTKTSDLSNDSGFITSIPEEYVTETELQGKKYATKTELEQGLEGKQPVGDYLTEESDPTVPSWAKQPNKPTYTADEVGAIAKGGLKTINGQSIEGSGNIEIEGGGGGIADAPSDGKQYARQNGSWAEVEKTDISGLATKEELKAKADVSAIPTKVSQLQNDSNFLTSVPENYVTEEELAGKKYATDTDLQSKQDTLVSGTNIKTINGLSLLGEGNIEIESGQSTVYDADNVLFKTDLTITANVGVHTVGSTGSKTLATTGKSIKQVMDMLFAEEKNPTITQPSANITLNSAGAKEAGTMFTPTYSASLNAGLYQYGGATEDVAISYSVTDKNSNSSTNSSGSFSEFQVTDATNYNVSVTIQHSEGTIPKTNLGNDYEAGKITAGSKSKTSSSVTGYRNTFYGTLTNKSDLTSDAVRTLTKSNRALANGATFNINIPLGALRVVIAYPSTLRPLTSVLDVNGLNAQIVGSFTESSLNVEGMNGYQSIAYRVYTLDYANPNDTANTYKVTI